MLSKARPLQAFEMPTTHSSQHADIIAASAVLNSSPLADAGYSWFAIIDVAATLRYIQTAKWLKPLPSRRSAHASASKINEHYCWSLYRCRRFQLKRLYFASRIHISHLFASDYITDIARWLGAYGDDLMDYQCRDAGKLDDILFASLENLGRAFLARLDKKWGRMTDFRQIGPIIIAEWRHALFSFSRDVVTIDTALPYLGLRRSRSITHIFMRVSSYFRGWFLSFDMNENKTRVLIPGEMYYNIMQLTLARMISFCLKIVPPRHTANTATQMLLTLAIPCPAAAAGRELPAPAASIIWFYWASPAGHTLHYEYRLISRISARKSCWLTFSICLLRRCMIRSRYCASLTLAAARTAGFSLLMASPPPILVAPARRRRPDGPDGVLDDDARRDTRLLLLREIKALSRRRVRFSLSASGRSPPCLCRRRLEPV